MGILVANLPAFVNYMRDTKPTGGASGDRDAWLSPNSMAVRINGAVYALTQQETLQLSDSTNWDDSSYATPANRAGKDFYVYACQPSSGVSPGLIFSANGTYPTGYTADTSRKIGGFHCLCVDVGTISGHSLSGYVAGDILPASVWDLLHRPHEDCSPEGMVYSAQARIWVDIYLQSGTGESTASAYGATITDSRNWMDFTDDLGAVGKRMLRDREFQVIAAGSNEETNIQGSADPGTTGGHVDTAGRRMISDIGCEDCAGVMYQWLDEQSFRNNDDGSSGTFGWYDLPGSKGSLYRQGSYGDVKLRAGAVWNDGSYCGSRARSAPNSRWLAYSSLGVRGAAEPV